MSILIYLAWLQRTLVLKLMIAVTIFIILVSGINKGNRVSDMNFVWRYVKFLRIFAKSAL